MIETNNGKTLYNALNRIQELEAESARLKAQVKYLEAMRGIIGHIQLD